MVEDDELSRTQSHVSNDLAAEDNVQMSIAGIKMVFSKVGFYLVNIFIVYSLEITC